MSHNPSATYAPSVFAKEKGAEGCTKRTLTAAMNALFERGEIIVAEHGSGAKARKHIALRGGGSWPGMRGATPVQRPVQRGYDPPVQRTGNAGATGVRNTPLIPLALHPALAGGCAPLRRARGRGARGMAEWPYSTAQWRRLRLAKLGAAPLCEACERQGRTAPATVVDHRTPISAGGDPFPPLDGLASLCARHHNEKTAAHDRQESVTGRRFKGVDVDGNPLDAADAWHGGASDHGGSGGQGPTAPSRTDILSEPVGSDWVL